MTMKVLYSYLVSSVDSAGNNQKEPVSSINTLQINNMTSPIHSIDQCHDFKWYFRFRNFQQYASNAFFLSGKRFVQYFHLWSHSTEERRGDGLPGSGEKASDGHLLLASSDQPFSEEVSLREKGWGRTEDTVWGRVTFLLRAKSGWGGERLGDRSSHYRQTTT